MEIIFSSPLLFKGSLPLPLIFSYPSLPPSNPDIMLLKVMSGSKRGQQLFGVMQAGHLAPHEVVLDILAQVIKITEWQKSEPF